MRKILYIGLFIFAGGFAHAGDFNHPDKCGAGERHEQHETQAEALAYLEQFDPLGYEMVSAEIARKDYEDRYIAWKEATAVFHTMETVNDPIDWRLTARGINENVKTEAAVYVDWWFGSDFKQIRRNSQIAAIQRNYKRPEWVLFDRGYSMHNPGRAMVAGNAAVTPLPAPSDALEKKPFWRRDNIYAYGSGLAGIVAGGLVTDWYGLAKDSDSSPPPEDGGTLTNGDQTIQLPEIAFEGPFIIEQTEDGQSFDNRPREDEEEEPEAAVE